MPAIRTEFWKIYWLTGCGFVAKNDGRNTLLSALSPFCDFRLAIKKNILFCDYNNNLVQYSFWAHSLPAQNLGWNWLEFRASEYLLFLGSYNAAALWRTFGRVWKHIFQLKKTGKPQEGPRETLRKRPQEDPKEDPKKYPRILQGRPQERPSGIPPGRPQETL